MVPSLLTLQPCPSAPGRQRRGKQTSHFHAKAFGRSEVCELRVEGDYLTVRGAAARRRTGLGVRERGATQRRRYTCADTGGDPLTFPPPCFISALIVNPNWCPDRMVVADGECRYPALKRRSRSVVCMQLFGGTSLSVSSLDPFDRSAAKVHTAVLYGRQRANMVGLRPFCHSC